MGSWSVRKFEVSLKESFIVILTRRLAMRTRYARMLVAQPLPHTTSSGF